MQAEKLILTHFSQRYPKSIPIPTTMRQSSIVAAMDLMVISLQRFHELHEYRKDIRRILSARVFEDSNEDS
ncbi:hypothetical protein HMI54_001048 [Coelomomyces lativittatus]|nr:hypothetical protein HMI55_007222 [Coelomomyces lativittatus]KAJ1511102.1 hypothetical protein HMI54_001048 [Coelomomyces lativittatus]